MLMTVSFLTASAELRQIFNVDAIKHDGEFWLLYNAFTGVPTKISVAITITVNAQTEE